MWAAKRSMKRAAAPSAVFKPPSSTETSKVSVSPSSLESEGVRAFLVGEALMTATDPEEKLRELVT